MSRQAFAIFTSQNKGSNLLYIQDKQMSRDKLKNCFQTTYFSVQYILPFAVTSRLFISSNGIFSSFSTKPRFFDVTDEKKNSTKVKRQNRTIKIYSRRSIIFIAYLCDIHHPSSAASWKSLWYLHPSFSHLFLMP